MKELKEFTVERLDQVAKTPEKYDHRYLDNQLTASEARALAKIALAAKKFEPDFYIHGVEVCDSYGPDIELRAFNNALDASKCKDDHGGGITPVYTTPPLTHTEQDGWIKCSDRNPSDNGVYICWDGHAVKTYAFLFGNWQANQLILPNITHWMPRPAAPKPEM